MGWSVVGYGNLSLDYGDAIGVSHLVIVKQVIPDVIRVLESDFMERASEDSNISQEDLQFLSRMGKNSVPSAS